VMFVFLSAHIILTISGAIALGFGLFALAVS